MFINVKFGIPLIEMYRMSYSKIPLALKVEINHNLINIFINNFNAQPPYLQKLVPLHCQLSQ